MVPWSVSCGRSSSTSRPNLTFVSTLPPCDPARSKALLNSAALSNSTAPLNDTAALNDSFRPRERRLLESTRHPKSQPQAPVGLHVATARGTPTVPPSSQRALLIACPRSSPLASRKSTCQKLRPTVDVSYSPITVYKVWVFIVDLPASATDRVCNG